MNAVAPIHRISHANFNAHARSRYVANQPKGPYAGQEVVVGGRDLVVHHVGDNIAMVPSGYREDARPQKRAVLPMLFSIFA